MKLFDTQPRISRQDREVLAPHLGNEKTVGRYLHTASDDDIKRMILMEAEREIPRGVVLQKCLVALHKRERNAIFRAVYK